MKIMAQILSLKIMYASSVCHNQNYICHLQVKAKIANFKHPSLLNASIDVDLLEFCIQF